MGTPELPGAPVPVDPKCSPPATPGLGLPAGAAAAARPAAASSGHFLGVCCREQAPLPHAGWECLKKSSPGAIYANVIKQKCIKFKTQRGLRIKGGDGRWKAGSRGPRPQPLRPEAGGVTRTRCAERGERHCRRFGAIRPLFGKPGRSPAAPRSAARCGILSPAPLRPSPWQRGLAARRAPWRRAAAAAPPSSWWPSTGRSRAGR